jgi:hypothetical protein
VGLCGKGEILDPTTDNLCVTVGDLAVEEFPPFFQRIQIGGPPKSVKLRFFRKNFVAFCCKMS